MKTYRGAHVRHLCMTQKYAKRKMYPGKWVSIFCFLFIKQPSLIFAVRNFETTISIYLLMYNREFTFCKCVVCSAVSFVSYPEDGIIDLRQILDT